MINFFQDSSLANCIYHAAPWNMQFRWFMASVYKEILSWVDHDTLAEPYDGADESYYYLIEGMV